MMFNIDISNLIHEQIRLDLATETRKRQEDLKRLHGDILYRGQIGGTSMVLRISKFCEDEIENTAKLIWEKIANFVETPSASYSGKELSGDLKNIVVINLNEQIGDFDKKLPVNTKTSPTLENRIHAEKTKLKTIREEEVKKIINKIDLLSLSLNGRKVKSGIENSNKTYVAPSRIDELKSIQSKSFDLKKLIRLCEELNIAYGNECYYATAMLNRAIIDHVPPILGYNKFDEVVNNYSGGKSFKALMKKLKSQKDNADDFLHVQIRTSETLPTENRVNFLQELDALLAEIYRALKAH